MSTTFCKITKVSESQSGKVAGYAEAADMTDKLIGGILVKDISAGGTITLTEADSYYACYILTGVLPSNTTLKFDVDIKHPVVFIRDASNATFTCTVAGASAGSTSDWEDLQLQQGDVVVAFFHATYGSDLGFTAFGTGNVLFKGSSVATGAFGSSAVVSREVVTARACIRANAVGSQAVLATAATAQTDFIFKVNGTDKGTIRFAAAGTVATFVGNFSTKIDLVPGDIITVEAPASADATASGLAFSIKGHRR